MSALDYLWTGDLLHALISPFLAVMGSWFYVSMIGLVMALIYMKSQSAALVYIVGLLTAGSLLTILPWEAQMPIYLLLALCGIGIIYRIFKR